MRFGSQNLFEASRAGYGIKLVPLSDNGSDVDLSTVGTSRFTKRDPCRTLHWMTTEMVISDAKETIEPAANAETTSVNIVAHSEGALANTSN